MSLVNAWGFDLNPDYNNWSVDLLLGYPFPLASPAPPPPPPVVVTFLPESTSDLYYYRAYMGNLNPRLVNTYTPQTNTVPLESQDNLNYWRAYLSRL